MSHFYYWRNSKHGPKKGALVFDEGYLKFDLNDQASFDAACQRLSEAIGEVYLAPADNTYYGESKKFNCHGKSSPDLEKAIQSLREAITEKQAYNLRFQTEPAFALQERIKRHDWTYWASDDIRAWSAGHDNLSAIKKLIPLVPNAEEIWNEHAPKDHQFPG